MEDLSFYGSIEVFANTILER